VRASHRYGLTPRQFLTAMDLPINSTKRDLEQVLVDERSAILTVLGTEPPAAAMVPLLDDNRLSESVPKNASSRYCPECLASGRAWSTVWQQPWVVACHHHHLTLYSTCPSCGQRQWSSQAWGGRFTDHARCTERLPRASTTTRTVRPWCNADLSDAERISASEATLDAQQQLLALLTNSQDASDAVSDLGPWSVTAAQHLHTLCALIRLSIAQTTSTASWADHLAHANKAYNDLNQPDGSGSTIDAMLSDHSTTGLLGPREQALHSALGSVLGAAGIRPVASAVPASSRP